jgi:hypothetical protein
MLQQGLPFSLVFSLPEHVEKIAQQEGIKVPEP